MYKTLKTWKDLESEHASPQVLERALRSAAQDDAADELIAVLTEESASLVAASTISREGGTVQIDGTGVELEIPPDAFQDIQGDQRVQITILPNRSFDKTAKCFEDNTTVMVQLLPHNLSLRPAAKLILPHCLKLKNVVNSDVKIFCSYHKTGMEPLWEDVTKSVTFKLLETSCEVHLQRLCAIKYTISGNEVEAKRLKWYALGNKCKEDAKYVTVDIGYHLDLPVENEVYRGKLQDKFLGDSQSFFVFKEEPPSYLSVSLVQVLPVWELRPISAVSMSTSRPRTVLSSKQCCSFTFKRPCSSASLPRCVFEIAGDPQQPKYRLNVNFRALQKPVANTNVVTDDALFYLSHGLEDAWKNIGRRLLVDENDLQEISKRDVSLQLKAYLMLIKWKESVGETAFVEILIRVLNDEKTGLAKKLPASLIDGDASSHERNRLILPDKYSLMDSSDVSVEGGEVRISDTDIELNILPDSFLGPFEKHKIQLKVLPDNFFQEPAKLFEAHSTTIVELLPSDLRLKRPASLFLPHCLKLKSTKYCEVQVFQSHHAKGMSRKYHTEIFIIILSIIFVSFYLLAIYLFC
ncbi:hypothetical protein HOLleu_02054 [Holothuria leucospilota]|uniref:Netrin receptor UNC5 n=1 Tax=Holothuria leucospilota TaxID=206669 RepID=A0A9Q1CQ60_HOLLE|nr:hypothetical protein HOLleu_02054 [Holothuria leucospilota]